MMISLIPLFVRMIFIHFVLIYGTNNVETVGYVFTETQVYHREIGARLVLPARIFYAMFIWLNKLTVSEFLKRITIRIWRRSYEITLQGIRIFLFVTFGGVVIATLAECQPFNHYWQVIPDPGAHCRQGYAQLLTMGTCDIVTDILLIGFPIPVVLNSGQSWKRKLQMVSLFSLSVVMIAITATRMPEVIRKHGRQQYRTVWASAEILGSAAVSNAVILGSFLRDKGTKRNKFRTYSNTDSIDRASARRPTLARLQTNDSDDDLFFALGCRVPEHLKEEYVSSPRPAPPALPASQSHRAIEFASGALGHSPRDREGSSDSDESLQKPAIPQVLPSPTASTNNRSMSFFDVGNLLEEQEHSPKSGSRATTVNESGGPGISSHDFASRPSVENYSRPGSRAFLRDIGGLLTPGSSDRNESRESSSSPRRNRDRPDHRSPQNRLRPGAPIGVLGPMLERHETDVSLQDAGGLLYPVKSSPVESRRTSQQAPGQWQRTHSQPMHVVRENGGSSPPRGDEIELEDIGGLLSDDREESAAALRRISERHPRYRMPPSSSISETERRQSGGGRGFDDMILHDPGGLMER